MRGKEQRREGRKEKSGNRGQEWRKKKKEREKRKRSCFLRLHKRAHLILRGSKFANLVSSRKLVVV